MPKKQGAKKKKVKKKKKTLVVVGSVEGCFCFWGFSKVGICWDDVVVFGFGCCLILLRWLCFMCVDYGVNALASSWWREDVGGMLVQWLEAN